MVGEHINFFLILMSFVTIGLLSGQNQGDFFCHFQRRKNQLQFS